MEENKFQKAAEVLSKVWEKTVIDGHSVNCRAVSVDSLYKSTTLDPVWVANIVKNLDIVTKSSYETELHKTTSHFELLIQKCL